MKTLYVAALSLLAGVANADISNCSGVYVGMILVEKGAGLSGVTFHNTATATSGSYYLNFNGWSSDDKKAVLGVLTAAKMASQPINIKTEASSECGIDTTFQTLKRVELAPNL
jgi:hypothetical protein